MKAVEVIMEHGVPEERIIFINLVSELFQYNAECSDCRHCHDYPCRSLLLKDSRTALQVATVDKTKQHKRGTNCQWPDQLKSSNNEYERRTEVS